MANVFIVIVSIVLLLLTAAAVTYLMILYSHPEEREVKGAIAYRVFIIVGFTAGIGQMALIPLDTENTRANFGLDMETLWDIFLIFNAVMMILVLPFLLFYYETDTEANIVTRIADSICSYICFVMFFVSAFFIVHLTGNSYTISAPVSGVSLIYAVPSSTSLEEYKYVNSTTNLTVVGSPFPSVTTTSTWSTTVSTGILESMVGIVCLVGYTLLTIYLGNGLIYFPYSLISAWLVKPKKLSSAEIQIIKMKLKRKLRDMIEKGKDLKTEQQGQALETKGFFSRMMGNTGLTTKLNAFSTAMDRMQKEMEVYRLQMNIQNFDPVLPLVKLILGAFGMIVSILTFINILFGSIIKSNGVPAYPLFDNLFNWIETKCGGVLATLLLLCLLLYWISCLLAGMAKLGLRFITLIAIHPVEYNNTWMNAFFVNLIIFLCCNYSIGLFVSKNMPKFTANTYCSRLYKLNISNVRSLKWAFSYGIFEIGILLMAGLSFLIIYAIEYFRGNKKNEEEVELERRMKELKPKK